MALFSMTILSRPSTMAGVRCSIRLRSHSYSCSLIDSASQCAFRFLSAQPRMMCACGAMPASMARSGMIGAVAAGANSAPFAAMPGIGNSAKRAPLSTAAGSARCFTPGMPCSGQGNPRRAPRRRSRRRGARFPVRACRRRACRSRVSANRPPKPCPPCCLDPEPGFIKPFRSGSAMPSRGPATEASIRRVAADSPHGKPLRRRVPEA